MDGWMDGWEAEPSVLGLCKALCVTLAFELFSPQLELDCTFEIP